MVCFRVPSVSHSECRVQVSYRTQPFVHSGSSMARDSAPDSAASAPKDTSSFDRRATSTTNQSLDVSVTVTMEWGAIVVRLRQPAVRHVHSPPHTFTLVAQAPINGLRWTSRRKSAYITTR